MNQAPSDGWRGSSAHTPHHGNPDNNPQQPHGRIFNNFGYRRNHFLDFTTQRTTKLNELTNITYRPGAPQQQQQQQPQHQPPPPAPPPPLPLQPAQQQPSQPQLGGANILLPHSYQQPGPPNGHTLPTLADLTQANQNPQHHPTPYNTHPPPPNASHTLPPPGNTLQQSPQGLASQDRERDARERERRGLEIIDSQRRQEQQMREQEQLNREREQTERAHREQLQHRSVQSHPGSIPIHQPVASNIPNSIHGTNGLLSTMASASGPAPTTNANSMPAVPHNAVQQQENAPRPTYLAQTVPAAPLPPQSMPTFAGPIPGPATMPVHAAVGQQQPILNVSSM